MMVVVVIIVVFLVGSWCCLCCISWLDVFEDGWVSCDGFFTTSGSDWSLILCLLLFWMAQDQKYSIVCSFLVGFALHHASWVCIHLRYVCYLHNFSCLFSQQHRALGLRCHQMIVPSGNLEFSFLVCSETTFHVVKFRLLSVELFCRLLEMTAFLASNSFLRDVQCEELCLRIACSVHSRK